MTIAVDLGRKANKNKQTKLDRFHCFKLVSTLDIQSGFLGDTSFCSIPHKYLQQIIWSFMGRKPDFVAFEH